MGGGGGRTQTSSYTMNSKLAGLQVISRREKNIYLAMREWGNLLHRFTSFAYT